MTEQTKLWVITGDVHEMQLWFLATWEVATVILLGGATV